MHKHSKYQTNRQRKDTFGEEEMFVQKSEEKKKPKLR